MEALSKIIENQKASKWTGIQTGSLLITDVECSMEEENMAALWKWITGRT
jgi:hypothetical protein